MRRPGPQSKEEFAASSKRMWETAAEFRAAGNVARAEMYEEAARIADEAVADYQKGRKRKPGKRDEAGWLVPTPGTKRRKVYDLMKAGASLEHIADVLGMTKQRIRSAMNQIKSPKKSVARS